MDEVGHDALRVDPQVEAPPGSFLVPKSEERRGVGVRMKSCVSGSAVLSLDRRG